MGIRSIAPYLYILVCSKAACSSCCKENRSHFKHIFSMTSRVSFRNLKEQLIIYLKFKIMICVGRLLSHLEDSPE